MKIVILLAASSVAASCATRETSFSRTYLNCVYHYHYEMGLSEASAEQKCR